MVVTRSLITVLGIVLIGTSIVLFWIPGIARPWVAVVAAALGLALVGTGFFVRSTEPAPVVDPDDVRELSDDRRRELVRGTSLFLREMEYRYSIRLDTRATAEQLYFTAEVNTIRLGFIPAIITDNASDRQGAGYVAFVHDGTRWRGPGLPCPGGQENAVRHAGRCVSPLATDEETAFG